MKEQKPKKFSIKMQKKLLYLYALIILAFILLSVRLSWIVKADGATYEKQVLSQQKYDSVTLPFRRGDLSGTDDGGAVRKFPGSGYDGSETVCDQSSGFFLVCPSQKADL